MRKIIIAICLCLAATSLPFISCSDSGGTTLLLPSGRQAGTLLALTEVYHQAWNGPEFVVASPTKDQVYTLRGADNAINCYEPNESGMHNIEGCGSVTDANLAGVNSAAVSPDGKFIYVTTPGADAVAWVTHANSTLQYVSMYTSTDIDGANGIAISADGKFAYVIAGTANAVAWFTRNTSTGALAYVDRYTDALIGAPTSVAIVDYQGTSIVLVTSSTNNSVVTFLRNTDTGALTYAYNATDTGFTGPTSIAASPFKVLYDPVCHVYASAGTTGSLGFFTLKTNGEIISTAIHATDYNTDLTGASSVALSPDGYYVYVAAPGANGIASFYRDKFGYLSYVDTFYSDFIDSVSSIAITSSGNYMFATSPTEDNLVILRIETLLR